MASLTPMGLLFLIFLLQFKHFICDGPLQTIGMVWAKRIYGKPLGLAHAGLHGFGSLIVMLAMGVPWGFSAGLALAEAALHYHIDFAKENIVRKAGWTVSDAYFWWALSFDQALHQATYLVMAAILIPQTGLTQ